MVVEKWTYKKEILRKEIFVYVLSFLKEQGHDVIKFENHWPKKQSKWLMSKSSHYEHGINTKLQLCFNHLLHILYYF